MGGFAIGVASKIKQPSLLVYQGHNTYFGWEFIYNPLMAGPTASQQTGVPPGVLAPRVAPRRSREQPKLRRAPRIVEPRPTQVAALIHIHQHPSAEGRQIRLHILPKHQRAVAVNKKGNCR